MAKKSRTDRGRNFFETSSPFETGVEPEGKVNTYTGKVDTPIEPKQNWTDIGSKEVHIDPQQYDNPRGYPGLALIQRGDEKPKLPHGGPEHNLAHSMQGSAALTRTGK